MPDDFVGNVICPAVRLEVAALQHLYQLIHRLPLLLMGASRLQELWVQTCPPLEDSLSRYGAIVSVNRPLRLSAS